MFLHTRSAKKDSQTAVEVEFWEGYLFRDRSGLQTTLCTYSLDNGPLPGVQPATLVFRFTHFDWSKNIRHLLEHHNIHYSVLREIAINSMNQLKKKVFIAEDDADILFALSTMLENAGYHVRLSTCGKPIFEGTYSWVDLFILDRQMPDVDGLNLCRYLRTQSSTRDTPIIVISAKPRTGSEALDAGADDYIEKPFQMLYLLNLVGKYTRRAV